MNELIIVKPEKCVGCNACVRTCPAPEANITRQLNDGRFVTSVDPERCIACGACIKACNHGARDFIDDTEECMSRLIREKIILIVSPAIKAVLPLKWKGVLDWFKGQGCTVYDAALGADICTWAHLRTIEQGKIGNIITQPCSAIVKYIEMYQPKLLKNLSPIQNPISCSATYIKKYLRRTNPIAALTPCIAAKAEFMDTGLVDYNVTIEKLMSYFERNGINIASDSGEDFEYKFDDQQGQLGSIFSRPGGLRDNLWAHDPELNIATSEGVTKVFPEIDMYARMSETKHPQVYDVLSCEFGCNLGPATASTQTSFDVMATMRLIEKEAKNRRKSGFMGRGDDKLFKRFDEDLRLSDFLRSYKPSTPSPLPTDKQLDPIFEKMGMHTADERKYDCHACGHKSCRDMAIAIYRGLNTPDNCIVHAKSVLLARHSALTLQHEKLSEIAAECLALSDKLKDGIATINKSVTGIDQSTHATSERATVVKDLLQNIVEFCSDNPTMDEDSVNQLISILKMTIDAFSDLDENVTVTSENSSAINKSVGEFRELIKGLNEVLEKTSNTRTDKVTASSKQ